MAKNDYFTFFSPKKMCMNSNWPQKAKIIFFINGQNNSNKIISTILISTQKNVNKNFAFLDVLSVCIKSFFLIFRENNYFPSWLFFYRKFPIQKYIWT